MVRPPIVESLEMSLRSETPLIKEPSIRGMAMSLRALIKMVPKGFTQWEIIWGPDSNVVKITPTKTPKVIPSRILQCKGIFFMRLKFG